MSNATLTELEIPAADIVAGDTLYDQRGVARKVTHVHVTGKTEDGTAYLAVRFTRGRGGQPVFFKSTDIARVWR